MAVMRYSATSIFGAPFNDAESVNGVEKVRELMDAYNIDPEPVETGLPTDITPHFWQKNDFSYWLSAKSADEAQIDLMPRHADSQTALLLSQDIGLVVPIRTIRIPGDQEAMVIAGGGSPRFAGSLCVYELICVEPV